MKNKTYILLLVLPLTIFILNACSSSDDDKDDEDKLVVPDDAISLTADNALDVLINGKAALDSGMSIVIDASDTLLKTSSDNTPPSTHFSDIALQIINSGKTGSTTQYAVNVDDTQPCETGTISYKGTYDFSEGIETVDGTITYSACEYRGAIISGSINTRSTVRPGISGSGFDNKGNITIVHNGITHRVSSYQSQWSNDVATELLTSAEAFVYTSTALGGGVLYQDSIIWQRHYSALGAHEGSAIIVGANNSRIRITAIDDTQFNLEVDANGNGNYEYSQVYSWSLLNT